MKRVYQLFIIFIYIIGFFSCSYKQNTFDYKDSLELNDDLEQVIEFDYYAQYQHRFYYNYYYGEHNGSYAFFQVGEATYCKNIMINDVVFRYYSDWEILIWSNHKFYKIEDAFLNNLLEEEDIVEIGYFHYEAYKHEYKENIEEFIKSYYLTDDISINIK